MRLIFFTREAFRALRRNAAPSGAAIVTTIVTVVLLGVLIPIFKATETTSSNVRDQLELRVGVYDDATETELAKPARGPRRPAARRSRSTSSPRRRRSRS